MPNLDSEMSLTELMDLANDAEVTQNDFEALINFDAAGNDFFAADSNTNNTTAARDKGGLGFDVNMNVNLMGLDAESKPVNFANVAEPSADRGSTEAHARAELDTELGLKLGE